MYNHSIETLQREVTQLQTEYERIVESSGFNSNKPELAEPEIIKVLVIIQDRLEDLDMSLYSLRDAKKFHLAYMGEV